MEGFLETFLEWLSANVQKAGPFAALLCLAWGISQYRRAEQERKERVALQVLLYGTGKKDDPLGIIERAVKGLNDSTHAIQSMTDVVRPLVNAVIEKAVGK